MEVLDMIIVASSAATILLIVFTYWRDQKLDEARQELFCHRNAVFRLAAEGRIRFDDPAYRKTRQSFNGMIRFAHRVYLLDFFYTLKQSNDDEPADETKHLLANIKDPVVREAMRKHHAAGIFAVMKLMVKRSVVLSSALCVLNHLLRRPMRNSPSVVKVKHRIAGVVRHEAMIEGAKTLNMAA